MSIFNKKPTAQVDADKAAAKASKSTEKQEFNQYIDEARGLERDFLDEVLTSRKNWRMAGFSGLGFGLFMLFFHLTNPITLKVPHVLRVDNATGAVEVVSSIRDQQKSYGEVEDKYWTSVFVRNYENYAYQSIQQSYDTVLTMANVDVAAGYKRIYTSDPKTGYVQRDLVLGKERTRQIAIVSVQVDPKTSAATVRFQTMTSGDPAPENWIATITYQYSKAKMSDDARLLNPLGFVVTSYRVEREFI